MIIDLHADPSCPFTWMTARWLSAATEARGDEWVVRPLSLDLLNADNDDVPEEYAVQHAASRRVLRVIEATRELGGDQAATRVYVEAGRRFHLEGDVGFDRLAAAVQDAGVDVAVLSAADDESYDDRLAAGLDEVRKLMDGDSGSPVVAIETEAGRRAFWGPIVTSVTRDPAAVLDALVTLAQEPGFSQVKGPMGDLEVA